MSISAEIGVNKGLQFGGLHYPVVIRLLDRLIWDVYGWVVSEPLCQELLFIEHGHDRCSISLSVVLVLFLILLPLAALLVLQVRLHVLLVIIVVLVLSINDLDLETGLAGSLFLDCLLSELD